MKKLINKKWLAMALVAGAVFVAAERRGFAQEAQHHSRGGVVAGGRSGNAAFSF